MAGAMPLWRLPLLLLPFLFPPRGQGQEDVPPTWHRYVRGPAEPVVYPKAVVSTTGDVDNAGALVGGGVDGEAAYLTRSCGSEVPAVVLDFGQNVVGSLVIEFIYSRTFGGACDGGVGVGVADADPSSASSSSSGGPAASFPGLRLVFSETLVFLGDRSDFTRSDNAPDEEARLVPGGSDQVAVKPGPYTWTDAWGCEVAGPPRQVCADGRHGFRYVRVALAALAGDAPRTTGCGAVGLRSVGLRWSGFRGAPATYAGRFECADAALTQAWYDAALTQAWYDAAYTAEMGLDTFRADDADPRRAAGAGLLGRAVLHDGAKRDRDPYVGDLAVSALTVYLTHPDAGAEAARNVLEDLARHQRSDGWIPPASINDYTLPLFDYPLWWVSCSWDHVFYTGNVSYLEAYYANLRAVLDDFYHERHRADDATLLLARPDGYGDFAFVARHGVVAYDNALYVLALQRGADLAELLHHGADDAQRWRRRAADVARQFDEALWDAAAGAFFDRRCDGGGKGCSAHAQDGNSLAVLAGIAPAGSAKAAAALAYLGRATRQDYGNAFYDAGGEQFDGGAGFSRRVYPFVSYFEAAARFEAGAAGAALEQLRRTYGWMAAHDPGGTAWEGIGAHGRPYQGGYTSMAHGWSTGLVPLAVRHVLGAAPTRPGFAAWRVAPRPGGLPWARGAVPTPRGPLRVRWHYSADRGGPDGPGAVFELVVVSPPGTQGVVAAPDLGPDAWRLAAVLLDGRAVYPDGAAAAAAGAAAGVVVEEGGEDDGRVRVRVEGGGTLVVRYSAFPSRWDGL